MEVRFFAKLNPFSGILVIEVFMFSSEQNLIDELPSLLKKASDNVFVVYQLDRKATGEVFVSKENIFKNADEQFEYMWDLPSSVEIVYLATAIKVKRICYRGNELSVAYDKINDEPKLSLYKDKKRPFKRFTANIQSIETSTQGLVKQLSQGR